MKKKLFFIHLGNLSNSSGHTARLRYELECLSEMADVYILSLVDGLDSVFLDKYSNIHFYALPVNFNGWEVIDVEQLVANIDEIITSINPNIVILCIEIWDLIVELHKKISAKIPFCTVCHAMPFLGSPMYPTRSFEIDVQNFINQEILKYRKDYIAKHYKEFSHIIHSGLLVANNATVAFYFKNYFPESLFWRQIPHVTIDPCEISNGSDIDYDFCYMARIEKGKGVEYLQDLFSMISIKLGRKIKVAIMGRADDDYSKRILKKLLDDQNEFVDIHFFGWADDKTKTKVLCKSGCFIYPSMYDNFPTVVNEALAHALPVVMWNNLFYKTNYSHIKSIAAANPLSVEHFASLAIDLYQRRLALSYYSIEYIKENGGSELVAKDDLVLFDEIIKHHEKNR